LFDRQRAAARLLAILDANESALYLHFMDAGGDSILAGELCELFRTEFDLDLDLDVWFESESLQAVLDQVARLAPR
jgi:hypothetical protein